MTPQSDASGTQNVPKWCNNRPQMKKGQRLAPLTCDYVVGLTGFEPATSRSRTERYTKLSHNP